jgi:hypothetical protein
MSTRPVLFVGVAALAALAACTPATRPSAAPSVAAPSTASSSAAPTPSASASASHSPSASASASASGNDGGQGGSSSVPPWSGVNFAAQARANTHCLPEATKDEVMAVKFSDLTGDGRTEALVTAACPSTTSQNPVAVFVYDGQDRQRPLKLLAAIGADHDLTDIKVSTHRRQVVIVAEGRSKHTGLCCPDLRITETWTYSDGRLHRTASQQQPL